MRAGLQYSLLVFWLSISWSASSQDKLAYYQKPVRQGTGFTLRAGLNYSLPSVTAYYASNLVPTTILWGIRPKTGFYVGLSYYTDLLPNRLGLRLDGTFSVKQISSQDLTGNQVRTASYEYVGLRPLLSLQITQQLRLLTGLEANVLVAHQRSWDNGEPVDIGPTIRATYQIRRLGLEVGYYRGLLKVDQLKLNLIGGPSQHDFYNQSLELGFTYSWH